MSPPSLNTELFQTHSPSVLVSWCGIGFTCVVRLQGELPPVCRDHMPNMCPSIPRHWKQRGSWIISQMAQHLLSVSILPPWIWFLSHGHYVNWAFQLVVSYKLWLHDIQVCWFHVDKVRLVSFFKGMKLTYTLLGCLLLVLFQSPGPQLRGFSPKTLHTLKFQNLIYV